MKRQQLSKMLLTAPEWIRRGLIDADFRARERAADALAAAILDRIERDQRSTEQSAVKIPEQG